MTCCEEHVNLMTNTLSKLDLKNLVSRVATRSISWGGTDWYWGDAILFDGVVDVALNINDQNLLDWSIGRINSWVTSATPSWSDCVAPIRGIGRLLDNGYSVDTIGIERFVQRYRSRPKNELGLPLLRPDESRWNQVVWVDSLYNIPAALLVASRLLNDSRLRHEALDFVTKTMEALSASNGLAHFYDGGLRRNNEICWSRGIGWAILGLLDAACEVIEDERKWLVDASKRLIAILSDQERFGHWPTVLGDPNASIELSTSAFYVAATCHEVWSQVATERPDSWTDSSSRAIEAVVSNLTTDGILHKVSRDTEASWEAVDYRWPKLGPSPWGQGSAIRAILSYALSHAPELER